MDQNRMSGVAERQSVTNTRSRPAACKEATRLCCGAKSTIVAPCSAKGAQISVGVASLPLEKSRSRTAPSSTAILFGFVQHGCAAGSRLLLPCADANSRVIAEANSLAYPKASAGQ